MTAVLKALLRQSVLACIVYKYGQSLWLPAYLKKWVNETYRLIHLLRWTEAAYTYVPGVLAIAVEKNNQTVASLNIVQTLSILRISSCFVMACVHTKQPHLSEL